MNKQEVDKMFDDVGLTWDDFHDYIAWKHKLDPQEELAREDVQGIIDRVTEWKNGK